MSKLRTDFGEIWTHGNILLMARDKCERFGWKVQQNVPDTCKPKGYIVISKLSRTISINYELPEHPELVEDKLIGAMEARRR